MNRKPKSVLRFISLLATVFLVYMALLRYFNEDPGDNWRIWVSLFFAAWFLWGAWKGHEYL